MSLKFYFYYGILAIGFLLGIFNFKKIDSSGKLITWCFFVTLVSEIIGKILAYKITNSSPPYHFLNLLQILIWSRFYMLNFNSKKKKVFVVVLGTSVFIYSLCNSFLKYGLFAFPEYSILGQHFFHIVLALLLYLEMLDWPSNIKLFRNPVFICTIAIIMFNFLSFIFFLLVSFMVKYKVKIPILAPIHTVSNFVYYLLLLYALRLNIIWNNNESRNG